MPGYSGGGGGLLSSDPVGGRSRASYLFRDMVYPKFSKVI